MGLESVVCSSFCCFRGFLCVCLISFLFSLQIPAEMKHYTVSAVDSASILLVIQGAATGQCSGQSLSLTRGTVLFLAAGSTLPLQVTSSDGMLMFRAYCLL